MSQSIQKSLDPPLFRFHQTCNDMHLLGYLPHLAIPKEGKKNLDRVYMFVAHPAFNNFLRPASIASTSLSVHDSAVPPP